MSLPALLASVALTFLASFVLRSHEQRRDQASALGQCWYDRRPDCSRQASAGKYGVMIFIALATYCSFSPTGAT